MVEHMESCSRNKGMEACDCGADYETLEKARRRAAMATSALDKQEGGNHYKDMKIQPIEFIHGNGIGYLEGNVIKYVCRWKNKNGVEDLRKARHYVDLLIEMVEQDD